MLIIDNKWLLIGPNRHGSLFCRDALSSAFNCKPARGDKPQHTPLCMMANLANKYEVVGIIRDPLRWYVSKWRIFWENAPEERRYGFAEYFNQHWQNIQGPIGKATESFPPVEADIGGWSAMHIAYHCLGAKGLLGACSVAQLQEWCPPIIQTAVDHMMCTETLCDDLVRVFGERIKSHLDKPRNATNPGDVLQYYNQERLALIAEKDGWLVSQYPQLLSYGMLCDGT